MKIITLKIDGKAVVIDQEYPRSTTWESVPAHTSNARGAITRLTGRFMHRSFHADQLGGALETEPRYVLLDHDYTTTDGRPADKIILISWIPDTSPVMKKMFVRGVYLCDATRCLPYAIDAIPRAGSTPARRKPSRARCRASPSTSTRRTWPRRLCRRSRRRARRSRRGRLT